MGFDLSTIPPYARIEGVCKDASEAFNKAKTDTEIQETGSQHQRCLERGYDAYKHELDKKQETVDLAVLGATVGVVVVVLIMIAKRWDQISATIRQLRIDLQAARQMREEDKQKDKADFATQVQERLHELQKEREG